MESARLSDLIKSLKSKNGQQINNQEIRIRYALERFLARLAQSEYRDKFILKGGFLMGTLYCVGQRSTKDLDALVRNIKGEAEEIRKALDSISGIVLNDNVTFQVAQIEKTQDQRMYSGFRAKMIMYFNGEQSRVNFDLDIDVGDVITPAALNLEMILTFNEISREKESITTLAYPIQTILAEKLETVLDKGIMNSRMKDFYDLRLLLNDPNRPEISLCYEAFRNTWNSRHQIEIDEELFEDWQFVIEDIENNDAINQIYWPNYTKDRRYVQGIEFNQIVHQVKDYILELKRYYLEDV